MIIIIHGEDITKSRKYFIEQRQQYHDAITINGLTTTLTEIVQVFEGNELFATEKHVFIEDFFSKRKKSKETEQIIKVIQQNHPQAFVYFWESKELSPAQLKQLNNVTVKQFKLPQAVFTFLDSIKPQNGKQLIQLFYQTIQDEETQFIFSMLIRQFRLLLYFVGANNDLPPQIDEIKRMSPWQKDKLAKQSKLFTKDSLKTHYAKLYEIEYGVKTGSLNTSLEQAIDFWLITL